MPLQIRKESEMNKHLIFIALACLMGLFLASCGEKTTILGTWVEPAAEDGIMPEKGFILYESGEVEPINMGKAEFHSWEKNGDMIYFKGTYTGTAPHDFVDTMKIVSIDENQLVLEQAGYQVTYQRKK